MASSSYYKRKKNEYIELKKRYYREKTTCETSRKELTDLVWKYSTLKTKINNLFPHVDNSQTVIVNSNNYLKELIISGKTIDDGKMASANNLISSVRSSLKKIITECDRNINECNTKITDYNNKINDYNSKITDCDNKIYSYQRQYESALQRERYMK